MATESNIDGRSQNSQAQTLLENLTGEQFNKWYHERQYRKNIENGTPYFNEPGKVTGPTRHSPSQLLQCHRKIFYRQNNAPAEQSSPYGIFWFGSHFEEDLIFPFLNRAVTGPETYVKNSEWIDFTTETDSTQVQIKGVTDPLIVDSDSIPLLPTEIKTKQSISALTSPNPHHKAQLHAYMIGLSNKFDIELLDGVLLYGSRQSLDVKVFHIEFDESFWHDTILNWASKQTQYRLNGELPLANPEYEWECDFCDFRECCGKGCTDTEGYGPRGLVPHFDKYPREMLVEYLDANQDARLTPTLACSHPELAETYEVADWKCESCSNTFRWDAIDWELDPANLPVCPDCANNQTLASLRDPTPIPERRDISGEGWEHA